MFKNEDFQSWFKENTPKEGLSENTTFTKQFVIDAWNDGYYTGYDEANKKLLKQKKLLKDLLKQLIKFILTKIDKDLGNCK